MKISLNWLKDYVKIPEEVSDEELIKLIGARLVEVEGVIDETCKYDNIYIVRVEKAEKIPDTHLTLCEIDNGEKELIQVVCGAPNVREGMLAVWLKPGAIVPASVKEDAPFVIGKRKMLGKYESNGMLAGADELDFGDDHSGIVEIDPTTAKPGDLLADIFNLKDLILEIENKSLTHRPDTFGIIGFAREVAGILGQGLAEPIFSASGLEFSSTSYAGAPAEPSLRDEPVGRGRNIRARNSNQNFMMPSKIGSVTLPKIQLDSNICSRYTAMVLEKHGELTKKYLTLEDTLISKAGMKPVNPIVDATNYLMLLTGQPLHAFDYDKFLKVGKSETVKIGVRLARKGEKLELLDGKMIECGPFDILITSGDVPVALAGAMGGKSTEIDENTKNILLESATFSLYNLRKTQMAHGIFSEAITRFTKGQSAYQTLGVVNCCAKMLTEGFRVTAIADEYPAPSKPSVVKITTSEINNLLGTDYSDELIVRTLKNVGFEVKNNRGKLEVVAPEWRMDIRISEDIIEEVGRLLGYDNIEPNLPLHGTAEKNWDFERKRKVRELLSRWGANEVLTYSFVSGRLLEKAGQDADNSYKIVNSISPELQYVRQSLIPSLLDKTYLNEKLPVEKFAIFEMNQVYQKKWGMDRDGVPVEKRSLGFVVAERKGNETAFYKAKKYLNELLEEFGVEVYYVPLKEGSALSAPFEPVRSAEVRLVSAPEALVGVIGEFKNSVRAEFKLADYLAGFEIDLDYLVKNEVKKIEIGQKKTEDLTIETDKTYAEVFETVKKKYPNAAIEPGAIYQPKGSKKKNITFHIEKIV